MVIALGAAAATIVLAVLLVDLRSTSLRRVLTVSAGLCAFMAVILTSQQYRGPLQAQNVALLYAFGAEADQLLEEGLRADFDADSATYRARADNFFGRLEGWVAFNIGPSALEAVRHHDPKDVNIKLESPTDNERASSITQIAQTKEKIASLVHAKASDRCVKPIRSEHPMPPGLG